MQTVELAKSEKPDIILMDLSLSVMDGWEASRIIKHMTGTYSLPVNVFTVHALARDREKAIEVGCDDYKIKPIDFPKLLAKIHAFIG